MPRSRATAVSHTNDWILSLREQPSPWLWEGVVAINAITLFSAPAKTGKTTLLSLLLDRRRAGGQLLGKSVIPGRTIVCSEEEPDVWAMRQPPLDFGPQVEFHSPLRLDPTPRRWRRFIDHLLGLEPGSSDIFVFDTVMRFLPAPENTPGAVRKALNELRLISNIPAGVLLLHQCSPVRGRSDTRGPLAAFADILFDMEAPPRDRFSRRRDFYGVGRYPGTLTHVSAELNPEGTDYLILPDAGRQPTLAPALETVRQVLSQCPAPLTRQEILARWPGPDLPRADSLWRTLEKGCEQGMFVRSGVGTRVEAFRYGLVECQLPKAGEPLP